MGERPEPHKLKVPGTELQYVEQGQEHSVPVVFVHGGLGDFRTWSGQMRPFAERYHAISYSRRLHYPNSFTPDPAGTPMRRHVEDLAILLKEVARSRAHIVANSYGGYISLLVAREQPELVRSLALAEPPVHPILRSVPGGEELFQEFMAGAWRPAGEAFEGGDLTEGVRLFIEGAVGTGAFNALPARVKEGMMKNAPELGVGTATPYADYMPAFTCEDAAQIQAPTLLMYGELSPRMYYVINDELARCLPHAEKAIIPDAAHVLHSQNPADHNRIVLDFLARH